MIEFYREVGETLKRCTSYFKHFFYWSRYAYKNITTRDFATRYKNLLLQDDITIGKSTIIRDSILPIPILGGYYSKSTLK